jgi:glutamine synthetase
MASQIYAGLDGIERNLDAGPPTETPYQKCAGVALPATLEEALAALRASACFRAGFGQDFVDYYARMKEAEIARCRRETTNNSELAGVSEWEHREYFDML